MSDFVYTNKQTLKNYNFSGENSLSPKVLEVSTPKSPLKGFWDRWLWIWSQNSEIQDGESNMADLKSNNDANLMKMYFWRFLEPLITHTMKTKLQIRGPIFKFQDSEYNMVDLFQKLSQISAKFRSGKKSLIYNYMYMDFIWIIWLYRIKKKMFVLKVSFLT